MTYTARAAKRPAPATTGNASGEALASFKGELEQLNTRVAGLAPSVQPEARAVVVSLRGCIELARRATERLVRAAAAERRTVLRIRSQLPESDGERTARTAQERADARERAERQFEADVVAGLRGRVGEANAEVAALAAQKAAEAVRTLARKVDVMKAHATLPEALLRTDDTAAAILARDEQRRAVEAQLRADFAGFVRAAKLTAELEPDRAVDLLDLAYPTLTEIAARTPAAQHWTHPTGRAGEATATVIAAGELLLLYERVRAARRAPMLDAAEEWLEHATALFRRMCGIDRAAVSRMSSAEISRRYMGSGSHPIDPYEVAEPGAWPFRLFDEPAQSQAMPFGEWKQR